VIVMATAMKADAMVMRAASTVMRDVSTENMMVLKW
jgi:hypothetical protein